METHAIAPVLASLYAELIGGVPAHGGYILNPGDQGLLASLDRLSADEASTSVHGGATIAAHTAHLSFGIGLMLRALTEGGAPYVDAPWYMAWRIDRVDDATWQDLREELREKTGRWQQALATPAEVPMEALQGMVASIGHLAYHMGAIRQIAVHARGPKDPTSPVAQVD